MKLTFGEKKLIYKFINNDICVYVGSTNNFFQRLNDHQRVINKKKKGCNKELYDYIRKHRHNIEIIIVNEYPHNLPKEELLLLEKKYIKELKPRYNKQKNCIRTKEEKKQYKKDYTNENREEINRKNNLNYHKNKKKYNNDRKGKIPCKICGKGISKRNMRRHIKNIHDGRQSQIAGNLEQSLTTTPPLKEDGGTRLIAEPNSNNVKELSNPQPSTETFKNGEGSETKRDWSYQKDRIKI